MLTTIITWLYALFTLFLLGFGVSAFVGKFLGYQIKKLDDLLMAGVIVATVYAQFFSLFYKVGLVANVVMLVACLGILVCRWDAIKDAIRSWHGSGGVATKVAVLVLFLLWAYFTSRGYMHYDSDLYHAQSIRWLEEYGVVPGLGNLHERFAYNSSFFALSALYSMRFVLGDSMHTMNGFFALLLSMTCLPIARSWKGRRLELADFARVGAIYYLTIITNEVVAPASDYAVMCVLFFVVIKWLDALQEDAGCIAPFALLCVVGVYTLSLKLTAGLILLLLIKPAYMLIREKRVKEIFIYLGMGLLVAIPWFARTVMISGWLLYPFTALDLFPVDWKMDPYYIDIDAIQIKVWGRALYDISLVDTPIAQWFPNWFATTLSGMEKLLILSSLAAGLCVLVAAGNILIKKGYRHLDALLVMVTLLASYLFWQTSAPLMRYGYAYVLLLISVVFGWCLNEWVLPVKVGAKGVGRLCYSTVYFALLVYGAYKVFVMGDYIYHTCQAGYYIWQEDYGVYEVDSYEIKGETFYYPVEGDRTGYDMFPSAPTKVELEFRGDTIKEGFRKK